MAAFFSARRASLLKDWAVNNPEGATSLCNSNRIDGESSGWRAELEGESQRIAEELETTGPEGGAGEEALEVVCDRLRLGLILLSLNGGGG